MFCLHKLRLRQVLDQLESYQQSLDPNSRRCHDYILGYLPHIRESLMDEWAIDNEFAFYRRSK
jgi:hypothetical protein